MFRSFQNFAELCCAALVALFAVTAEGAAPLPVGTSQVELTYPTASGGTASFSGSRDYEGVSPGDASYLPGAQPGNIGVFNSRRSFAWRNRVSVYYPQVIRANETVISHAFFKMQPSGIPNNDGEFFPGLEQGGSITFNIVNQTFDQPVLVDESTFLLHTLWDSDQIDMYGGPQGDHLLHPHHNVHSATDPFRDREFFDDEEAAFTEHPDPNYTLGAVSPIITGEGTNTLSVSLTLPYAMLQHLADDGMGDTDGLPAPQGFLEPFHVHFEYVVYPVPEPSAFVLLTAGAIAVARRRR